VDERFPGELATLRAEPTQPSMTTTMNSPPFSRSRCANAPLDISKQDTVLQDELARSSPPSPSMWSTWTAATLSPALPVKVVAAFKVEHTDPQAPRTDRHANGLRDAARRQLERNVKTGLPARAAETVERLTETGTDV
jgi:hypothetical protein